MLVAITPEEAERNKKVLKREGFSPEEVKFYAFRDIKTENMCRLREARVSFMRTLTRADRQTFQAEMDIEFRDYVVPAIQDGDIPDDVIHDIISPGVDFIDFVAGIWTDVMGGQHDVFAEKE